MRNTLGRTEIGVERETRYINTHRERCNSNLLNVCVREREREIVLLTFKCERERELSLIHI